MQQQYTVANGVSRRSYHSEIALLNVELVDLPRAFLGFAMNRAVAVVLAVSQAMVNLEEGIQQQSPVKGGPACGNGADFCVDVLLAGFGDVNGLGQWGSEQQGFIAGQRSVTLQNFLIAPAYLLHVVE